MYTNYQIKVKRVGYEIVSMIVLHLFLFCHDHGHLYTGTTGLDIVQAEAETVG